MKNAPRSLRGVLELTPDCANTWGKNEAQRVDQKIDIALDVFKTVGLDIP